MRIAVLGFGQSFLTWNMTGCLPGAVIYADDRAPYRAWNRAIPVVEKADKITQKVVFMDHEEPEISADVVVWSAAPDPASVSRAIEAQHRANTPFFLVLNGYAREAGVPWPFPPSFDPVICIPWDERSVSCHKVGKPLTLRDAAFCARFQPLWEAIGLVDLGGYGQ